MYLSTAWKDYRKLLNDFTLEISTPGRSSGIVLNLQETNHKKLKRSHQSKPLNNIALFFLKNGEFSIIFPCCA
jgi:hypothetical protein